MASVSVDPEALAITASGAGPEDGLTERAAFGGESGTGVAVGVWEGMGVAVGGGVAVAVAVGAGVGVPVAVGEGVGVAVAVGGGTGVSVEVGVAVGNAVGVTIGDGVSVAVGGGVVVAGAVADVDDSVAVCACANNGVTAIRDNAHAIALVFQRFIDPPFAKPNMPRCQAHAYRSAFVTPLLLGPPSDD